MEEFLGRRALNFGSRMTRWFARSNVAGNLSSVLNQASQLPMVAAENGYRHTTQALFDILSGRVRKSGFAEESDLLTGKHGVNFLVRTPGEMVTSALFKPAELADGLVSTIAVRAAYRRALDQGMSEEDAMRFADQYGTEIMASRAKGSKPNAFESRNFITQAVNMFQIEALNSWEHVARDLPRDFRHIAATQGKRKAALALAGVIVKALVGAFVMNRIDEELYGGTPAPFDLLGLTANFIASGEGLSTNQWIRRIIDNGMERVSGERIFGTDKRASDQEFDWESAGENLGYNVSNEVPFWRNVSGLLGWGDETLPVPDLAGGISDISEAVRGNGVFSGETGEAAANLASQMVPGGRQLNKTAQGIRTMLHGARMKGYGDNARLLYPVEDSIWNWVRAVMFGNSALAETEQYYSSGGRGLTKDQTQRYQSMVSEGTSREDALGLIRDMSGQSASEKYQTIVNSNLSDEEKLRQVGMVMGTDMETAAGNPTQWARLQTVMDAGVSLSDWYGLYSYKNRDGVKKDQVMEYINGLSISTDQKDALYRFCSYAESKIDEAPWH